MFMFLRRCACVEPSDPTNDTLKYWARTNVTASEIYWEALEVKVQPLLEQMQNAKTADNSADGNIMSDATADIIHCSS